MKAEVAKREIESLDYYLQNHTNDYSEESHTAMMMAIKALEQEPRWIPVSERLPEKNVEVLATTIWGAITIAERYSANDFFIHEGATNADIEEVIAWMPLPEPYKAESEG